MTEFEEVLETILEEYARRDTEGDFDTWEETDSFVKEKAEVLLAYANLKEDPVSEDLSQEIERRFPIIKAGDVKGVDSIRQDTGIDLSEDYNEVQQIKRNIFKAGAQWQKERTIDMACDLLFKSLPIVVDYYDGESFKDATDRGEFIKYFRKTLEEE